MVTENKYEEYRLLGCSTVWVWFEPTFRRYVSPPSSGQVNNMKSQVSRWLQTGHHRKGTLSEKGKTGWVRKWATRIDRRKGCVQGGQPGNIDPRSDRIARRGEGKPGYLEVSDPAAAELTEAETVLPGEILLREETGGLPRLTESSVFLSSDNQSAVTCLPVISCYSPALKMDAIRSSETSVQTRPTQCYIPEDDILHSHHRENLKSYMKINSSVIFKWEQQRTVVIFKLDHKRLKQVTVFTMVVPI
jgi:hypothetical protein